MKEIVVTIAPDGTTTVETKGYSGPECLKASKFVEDALGEKTLEIKTPEFFATQQQQQSQKG